MNSVCLQVQRSLIFSMLSWFGHIWNILKFQDWIKNWAWNDGCELQTVSVNLVMISVFYRFWYGVEYDHSKNDLDQITLTISFWKVIAIRSQSPKIWSRSKIYRDHFGSKSQLCFSILLTYSTLTFNLPKDIK